MAKRLFVAGTGTDVGKTYVTALILRTLRDNNVAAAYYKPAMSGNENDENGVRIPGDAAFVKTVSGTPQPVEEMCPYVYERALSPHLAARIEGNPFRMDVALQGLETVGTRYDFVTVEGAGGILCPLAAEEETLLLADFVVASGMPSVLVADAGLGTINHVGLTAFYMKERGIPLKGILLNRFDPRSEMHRDNLRMCERLTGVKVIACVRENETELEISWTDLLAMYE